jgi:hypothetical protein
MDNSQVPKIVIDDPDSNPPEEKRPMAKSDSARGGIGKARRRSLLVDTTSKFALSALPTIKSAAPPSTGNADEGMKIPPPFQRRSRADSTNSKRSVRKSVEISMQEPLSNFVNVLQEKVEDSSSSDSDEYVPPPNFNARRKSSILWHPNPTGSKMNLAEDVPARPFERRVSNAFHTMSQKMGLQSSSSKENTDSRSGNVLASGGDLKEQKSIQSEPDEENADGSSSDSEEYKPPPNFKMPRRSSIIWNPVPMGSRMDLAVPGHKEDSQLQAHERRVSSGAHSQIHKHSIRTSFLMDNSAPENEEIRQSQNDLKESEPAQIENEVVTAQQDDDESVLIYSINRPFWERYYQTIHQKYLEVVSYKAESMLLLLILVPFIILVSLLFSIDDTVLRDETTALGFKVFLVTIGMLAKQTVGVVNHRHSQLRTMIKMKNNEATVKSVLDAAEGKGTSRLLSITGSLVLT